MCTSVRFSPASGMALVAADRAATTNGVGSRTCDKACYHQSSCVLVAIPYNHQHMQGLKIIGMCVLAAVVYGIVHDQFTAQPS